MQPVGLPSLVISLSEMSAFVLTTANVSSKTTAMPPLALLSALCRSWCISLFYIFTSFNLCHPLSLASLFNTAGLVLRRYWSHCLSAQTSLLVESTFFSLANSLTLLLTVLYWSLLPVYCHWQSYFLLLPVSFSTVFRIAVYH